MNKSVARLSSSYLVDTQLAQAKLSEILLAVNCLELTIFF